MADSLLPTGYDKKLEGLRGFCAMVVIFNHFLFFDFFQSLKVPGFNYFANLEFAHEAVLIFFVISGYVMGLNHLNEKYSYVNVVSYLKKRLLRLYPIYIIALIISFAGSNVFPVGQLVYHLFFLQEFMVKTIGSNIVLWSLSYEVFYYILFLGLWFSGKNVLKVCLTLAVVIIAFVAFSPELTILKSALIGWLFWMLGLGISQISKIAQEVKPVKWSSVFSYFALLLSIHCLGTGQLFSNILHYKLNFAYKIQVIDLLYLPVCFVIIMMITGRTIKYFSLIKLLTFAIPALNIIALIYFRHHLFSNLHWIFGIIYFLLSLIFLPINLTGKFFEKLNNIGRISYALYIFHFPVFYFLNAWLSQYLSWPLLLIIGLPCWAIITLFLSIVTERVLQPRIKKFFFAKAQ